MRTHTPGPWIAAAGRVIGPNNEHIADVHHAWASNSPVIAAGPELLDTLKLLVEHVRFTDDVERRRVIARADAVIAKAEAR